MANEFLIYPRKKEMGFHAEHAPKSPTERLEAIVQARELGDSIHAIGSMVYDYECDGFYGVKGNGKKKSQENNS